MQSLSGFVIKAGTGKKLQSSIRSFKRKSRLTSLKVFIMFLQD